ncbi:MAG: universal stress protein [Ignavibacteriae bacterium]|nr:MAG: universal stress protein [Ignavibacteriota bacterium]
MPTKKVRSKKKAAPSKAKPVRHSFIDIQRILVPIDFSEHSKNALKYAIPFAEKFKSSIDVLYVVEPTVYPADFSFGQIGFPNVEEELRTRGSDELENLLAKEIGGKVPARKAVRTGKPFYEINQYALEEKISLIIIATHGHTGMEQILFGSTAEKVVRKAPCPVLVVRSGEHEFIKV